MDILSDPFAPKSPPKRTKSGPLHQFNTFKASGYLTLSLLATNAVIVGQYLARYSGLTVDICLSDHPDEEKLCEVYVFELLGVAVTGLLLVLLAGAIVQSYSGERMDQIMQYVGAGLVGGFAWGWGFDRELCVRALETDGDHGKDCIMNPTVEMTILIDHSISSLKDDDDGDDEACNSAFVVGLSFTFTDIATRKQLPNK
ncbi:hypothetical protein KEM54_002915 [Ascosphaera aggregata]|nr:hypothetical protein KEM54_002915 [Ascosphaera aggregata]